MKSLTVKVGPGVFRRRGALPRPPDRTQVADELVEHVPSLQAQVVAVFREAGKRSSR